MPQHSVRYVRWGSTSRTSKSDASMLIVEKCVKYKKKLDAVCQKNKGLTQKNKKPVQALEAAKAKIIELEEAASRQLKIDSLFLPRLKEWLDAEKSSMSAMLKNCVRSTKLLQDILTPDANLTLTVEPNCARSTKLLQDILTPDANLTLTVEPNCAHSTKLLQDILTPDANLTLTVEPNCAHSTKLLQDILTPDANLTLTAEPSLQDEAAATRPSLHPPGSRYCDEDRMSMVVEEDKDKAEVVEPLRDSTGPLEEVTPEVARSSRAPVATQGFSKEYGMKEFGAEVTNTLLLSPPPCVLDEAFVEFPRPTHLSKRTTPSPERVGNCWGDENTPSLARIRRRQSANKSRAAGGMKPKASRGTFVVKRRRGSKMHEDEATGPIDDAPSLPDPSVDGRWEEGCEDGTPQRQHPAALDVVDPPAVRHRASLPKKQRDATEKRGKPRGKKSEGKEKTADTEEEPAPQPTAPAPYPVKKQPEGGKSLGKKLQGKRKTAGIEEPNPQLAAPAPQLAAPAPNAAEKQPAGRKSRRKKLQGKRIADCEEEQALQPAVPVSLPSPSPCAQHNGCPPRPEPLDAVPTLSADYSSSSHCTRSGCPARTATKCTTYKLPSLSKKVRRP